MINYRNIILVLLLVICNGAYAERTRDKMYSSILGASCFRRLNATHQTGCSSNFAGSVGVLYVVETVADFDFFINSPPSPPYAPVIPPHLFTRENIMRLKNEASKYVSVILVINETKNLTNFSHESSCPNQFSGLVSGQTCDISKPETSWNPFGTGLLLEDFPFPIYFVRDTKEIEKIVNCFIKFNKFDVAGHSQRSLCSVQVNAFMLAAVNSEVCMRRTNSVNNLTPTRYCDPLQGKNIYTTLHPREIVESNQRTVDQSEKFILISTRLDTTSMFDGVGLGAMDSLLSFASVVNAAHFLAKILPESKNSKRNVLFMVFNGESYDYIGSQRFVYDLKKNTFPSKTANTRPISLENIELMIDIGVLDDITNITVYHAQEFVLLNKFWSLLTAYNQKYNLGLGLSQLQTTNLPPTSAQSFLRDNLTFPAAIINSIPKNKFYHSVYDDGVNIGFEYKNTSADFTQLDNSNRIEYFANNDIQIQIRNISTAIALSVYELVTDTPYTGVEIASSVLADEFLFCFLRSADCPLFVAASHPKSLHGLPAPPVRYISVQSSLQEAAGWTYRILGLLTGELLPNIAMENCTQLPLYWFSGYNKSGECRYTKQNYSQAYSPAFLEENYDWKSGQYSTWTESTWFEISARIFLRPSKTHETVTLAIGLVVMIMSFIIVFLINSRSDVLFGNSPSTSTITEPAAC